jgi:hypothetical protein
MMKDFRRPHLWVDFILHVEFQTSTPYFAQHCLHVYGYPSLKFYIFDICFVVYTHTQVGWSCSGESLWWLNTVEISFTQYKDWSFYFFLLIIKFLPKKIITWFSSSINSSKGKKKRKVHEIICAQHWIVIWL